MEQQSFKISEVVEGIKKSYTDSPFKATPQENEQFPLNENLMNKAILRFCDMWNKDVKSRNFIKHLIGNFLPINSFNKILNFSEDDIKNNKNRDCILGIKLAGLHEISKAFAKISTTKMMIDAKANLEHRKDYTEAEKKELYAIRDSFPLEIRKASFAFCADASDKYMCRESINALLLFTEQCILSDEKEICFLINKKRISETNASIAKEKQLDNKQLNRVVKASTFGMTSLLDDTTIDKLKKMM